MEADGVAAERPSVRPTPWRVAWSLAARRRLDLVAVAAAVAGLLAFHYSGAAAGARDSFVFMGFDIDRAYLLVGGMAAVLSHVPGSLSQRRHALAAAQGYKLQAFGHALLPPRINSAT